MLLRASRQRLQSHAAFQPLLEAEPLQLPFLCPALYRPSVRVRKTSSKPSPPLETHINSPRPTIRPRYDRLTRESRGLASAAAMEYEPSQEEFVPFEMQPYLQYKDTPQFGPETIPPLQGFDVSPMPMILDDTPTTSPHVNYRSVNAISGDLNTIHQTLHACLQVGRLERAAALVKRLNQIYKPDAPGLLAAHKDYLRELTLAVIRKKDMRLLQNLLSWVEVEIRRRGIPQDAQTFALVIQACLQDPNDKRCARLIRRYYNFAREAGVEDETRKLVPDMEDVLKNMAWYLERRSFPLEAVNQGTMPDNSNPDPVPSIRHVNVKGQGLVTLQRSLSSLRARDTSNDPMHGIDEAPHNLTDFDRQRILEHTTADAALERWRHEDNHLRSIGINSVLHERSHLGAIMWNWHEKLELLITTELRLAHEAESKSVRTKADEDRLQWSPYLQSIPAEKVSATTILACMTGMAHEGCGAGVKVVSLLHRIGSAVQDESFAEAAKKDSHVEHWRMLSRGGVRPWKRLRSRSPTFSVPAHEGSDDPHTKETIRWPQAVRFKLAAMLLTKLIEAARIDVSRQDDKTGRQILEPRPAFFHTFQYRLGKRVGVIRLNSTMVEMMTKAPVGSVLAKHLPMVCEPKPWVGFREGGFVEHKIKVVRFQDTDQHSKLYAETAAENGDLVQVFAGLDVLGKTPWKINRSVYETMAQAWNIGDAIANIPAENPVMEYPTEPSPQAEPKDRRRWLNQLQEVENEKAALRSERCFQNFQVEIARAFIHETFYFPHNIDFRGRAYPMAPFLNHMGADHARGLLIFAKGKELGSTGIWWLKVHLANVHGYDKASFKDRLLFTEKHLAEIHDSAMKPLDGGRWWLQAEDPWQCLAACMELHNALRLSDPSGFVSHLPIQQDGTCNGLQHYAALGGDVVGAKQVNLEPGDRPSDIYTGVAEMIKAEVKGEAEGGLAIAKALDGHITRKVVKQTVMTNVYGVTFVGAKRQVRKQLEALLPDFPKTPRLNLGIASEYIARKIFSALATMFNGAHDIQYWLGECARRICDSMSPGQIAQLEKEKKGEKPPEIYRRKDRKKSKKNDGLDFATPVTWTTPLKLPVVQPYRKEGRLRVQTEMQGVSLVHVSSNNPIDRTRQLSAFPPNFIHSLDGTHMFLTALRCNELGLTFASVHDSFWTHAADVDTMNTVTRDAFVRMHSENIVARLAAEFEARYNGHMRMATLDSNSSAGRKIREWRQTHTHGKASSDFRTAVGKTEELLLEVQRLRLLTSSDMKAREEGEAMVTPCSIFAEASPEEQVSVADRGPTTLGQTSTRQEKLRANETLAVGDMENTETTESVPGDEASVAVADGRTVVDESGSEVEAASEMSERKGNEDHGNRKGILSGKKPAPKRKTKTWVWVPLTFPPVPERGAFDVRRLKDSPYFFS